MSLSLIRRLPKEDHLECFHDEKNTLIKQKNVIRVFMNVVKIPVKRVKYLYIYLYLHNIHINIYITIAAIIVYRVMR